MGIIKKILIVDDESSIRWILNLALVNNLYEVFEAANGSEGVEMAKKWNPDLIIMDYKMPDMNGWDATRSIRSFSPNVPIIGHTAYANLENEAEGMLAGCTEILKKPIDLSDWELTINKYMISAGKS